MPVLNEYRIGKYKFSFVAPRRTSDSRGYYSLKSISGIPKDYIRMYFVIRECDNLKKAEVNSVSIPTWEAIKGKFILITSFKVKEGKEELQTNIMEELSALLKRQYRTSKITIIPVETEEDTEEQDENI